MIPQSIKDKKPTDFGCVEIRCFNGYYHVYQVISKWDKEKKRSRKITGKSVGTITEEDGFIPNANAYRIMIEEGRLKKVDF